MEIALHEIEPWLIQYQFVRYNLAESGMVNQTVGQLLEATGGSPEELLRQSFDNADTRGSRALREAIAALYDGVEPDDVLVTTGTSEALFLYSHVRHRPGANVVVPTPAFQSLPEVPRYLGYEVRELPLKVEQGFRLDLGALERLVDANTRTVVMNNPQNPTGMRLTDAEISEVRRLASKVGAEVLADEHYRFVPLDDEAQLIPSLYTPDGGTVAIGSMIKCMGCVGLRVGWMIGPKSLLDACRDLKDYTTHTLCSMNDYVATQALRHWQPVMRLYRAWVKENVAAFTAFMARHADVLGWVPPQGGLVAFPYLRDASVASAHLSRRLVETREVFVLPGETFGRPGHFRVGFGLPPARFAEALARWSDFLSERAWK
ncbi:aminotransferase class I/II-fold pyridoxal phosphate-dependent enzyme [Myxococcaceae bacterium JPH2]|nr:aminotransferase class I/II-fold pyridoxal phosphate-dependent enzyme [Myxococcaceae bacterium JPH2]